PIREADSLPLGRTLKMTGSAHIIQISSKLLLTIALVTLTTGELALATRAITVKDCVETQRVLDEEVQISPDGSRVAFVVKAPDVLSNRNHYQLRIRDLRNSAIRDNGHLLLQADKIS